MKKFLGPHVLPNLTAVPGTTRPTAPVPTTAPIMPRVEGGSRTPGWPILSGTSPEDEMNIDQTKLIETPDSSRVISRRDRQGGRIYGTENVSICRSNLYPWR